MWCLLLNPGSHSDKWKGPWTRWHSSTNKGQTINDLGGPRAENSCWVFFFWPTPVEFFFFQVVELSFFFFQVIELSFFFFQVVELSFFIPRRVAVELFLPLLPKPPPQTINGSSLRWEGPWTRWDTSTNNMGGTTDGILLQITWEGLQMGYFYK